MRLLKGCVIGFIAGIIVTAAITAFADYISVEFNKITLFVNNVQVKSDTILYNDTTYVPLRRVAEMLDKDVYWNGKTMAAFINDKKPKTEYTLKGYMLSSLTITEDVYRSKVMGEIENAGARDRRQVVFTFNFYDENNRLIGMATAVVDNLTRGEKKSFAAYGDPIQGYKSYTVQIDSEI